MSRGGKKTYPHIWSNGGAPANSPKTLPALLPAPLTFGKGHASPWSTTAPQSTGACEGARAEGEGRGDPDNYSSRRGEAMQAPREGRVVIAALMLISNTGSAAGF